MALSACQPSSLQSHSLSLTPASHGSTLVISLINRKHIISSSFLLFFLLCSSGELSAEQGSMGQFQNHRRISTLYNDKRIRHRGKRCFRTKTSRMGEMSELAFRCARRWLSNRSLTKRKTNWTREKQTKIINCTDNKETLGILTLLSEHCDYFMSGSSCAKCQCFFSYSLFPLVWLVENQVYNSYHRVL